MMAGLKDVINNVIYLMWVHAVHSSAGIKELHEITEVKQPICRVELCTCMHRHTPVCQYNMLSKGNMLYHVMK